MVLTVPGGGKKKKNKPLNWTQLGILIIVKHLSASTKKPCSALSTQPRPSTAVTVCYHPGHAGCSRVRGGKVERRDKGLALSSHRMPMGSFCIYFGRLQGLVQAAHGFFSVLLYKASPRAWGLMAGCDFLETQLKIRAKETLLGFRQQRLP